MRATATWEGNYRTRLIDDRGHEVLIDLPRDEEGEDAGTSALELSVLSLAGCISTIFALVADRRRLLFEGMTVDLEAIRPDHSPTITAVEGTARIVTDAPAEDVAIALNITLRTCPVGVLFHQAGIPVHVRPQVVPSALPPSGRVRGIA